MLKLAGYKIIQEIYTGSNSIVYRGYSEREERPIVVKVTQSEYPTLSEVTKLRHEYKINQGLDSSGIVKAYSLENYRNGFALILEDFGGISLQQFLTVETLSLEEILRLTISLVETLGYLHKNSIIHKDIKPSNILLNPATKEVKLTDFSIATRLEQENQSSGISFQINGTLAYMSPEQTGKMNRSIDYRTDFYSLGITLYEILTGSLPFVTEDPLELIHSHLAKQAIPPAEVAKPRSEGSSNLKGIEEEIPQILSDIIMKLLSKTAEDRYQSEAGLKFDLENCLQQLENTGRIEPFPLATRDKGNQLLIPQKLYGREREVSLLLQAFERVCSASFDASCQTEMILVSGYSGIGKTAIVNEVQKPIVRQKGYFISGKFDQFKRNIPYSALIEAFRGLIEQLLTESAEKIANWKRLLLEALGPNGQAIVDVIPEVELIVGPQPPLPQVGPTESQNRFNRVFQEFLGVFCRPAHPLVIFLDDLQWADSASLKLIQLLLSDADSKHLLTIGAYRDNEVYPTHPLIQTLEKIREANTPLHNITVQPLGLNHVNQLIAETLSESEEAPRLQTLSELLFNKTQGNPFFLTQLLKTLYSEKLLTYEANRDIWVWDVEEIQTIGITDLNVVELIARNLKKLPEATQKVLKLAACIGSTFNLDVLAIVNEESEVVTGSQLWEALQSGLILPLSESYKIPLVFADAEEGVLQLQDVKVDYKFLHDRVQQATYSLIPEPEKKITHLKIGQLLLNNMAPEEQKDNIFALVNQLNFGLDLLSEPSEKEQLSELNLFAGQKAKAATAYEAAVTYLNIALNLLAVDSWQSLYDLTLTLHVEAVEAEYLSTNFERSEQLAEVVLQHATTLLDKVKVYELKIQSYISQFKMQAAIDIGLAVLENLGISLSDTSEDPFALIQAIDRKLAEEHQQIEDLATLPEMTDPYKLASIRIALTLTAVAYIINPPLMSRLLFIMVNLCMNYGNPPLAAGVYVNYGVFLSVVGNINSGYQFGELSLRLLEQFNARAITALVRQFFHSFIQHWKDPVRGTIDSLQDTVNIGFETGNVEYACYASISACTHTFFSGIDLETSLERYTNYIRLVQKFKQSFAQINLEIGKKIILDILGESSTSERSGDRSEGDNILSILKETHNYLALSLFYLGKTIAAYLFQDYSAALEYAREGELYKQASGGLIMTGQHHFYYSLALLAQYPNASEAEQQEFLQQVAANQDKLRVWTGHAPANYQHKYELVEAEKARVLGDFITATTLYDRAITDAREQGFTQEEAIANELMGEFQFVRGQENMARFFLIEAYYAYIRWGAKSKAKDLESRYPQIFARILTQRLPIYRDTVATKTTTGGTREAFDFAAALKASQAISSEIVLSGLLTNLMKIVLENAGAQKGYLILQQGEDLRIEAVSFLENETITVTLTSVLDLAQAVPLTAINYVQRTQRDVILDDAVADPLFAKDPYIVTNQPKSVSCIAIVNQGKLLGILYLENNLATNAFTPARVEVLKLLSAQAAISIENALLYRTLEQKVEERTAQLQEANRQLAQANQEITVLNDRLKAENIRLSAEIEVTRRLQQMLLPKEEELSQIENLDISGFMEPADEVGGDYYDVLSRAGQVKIGIGDVTGHGLESGVLMLMAQTTVRTLLEGDVTDEKLFLDILNRTMYQNAQRMDSRRNMTLALLDYSNGLLKLSGQHEEIIIVRAHGEVERIDTVYLGFPIALVEEIADFVASAEVQLNRGDVVVLYTDGITEAIDINQSQYGLEKLIQVVQQNCERSAQEIRQAVVDDVRRHIGEQKVYDDITIVVIKQR